MVVVVCLDHLKNLVHLPDGSLAMKAEICEDLERGIAGIGILPSCQLHSLIQLFSLLPAGLGTEMPADVSDDVGDSLRAAAKVS